VACDPGTASSTSQLGQPCPQCPASYFSQRLQCRPRCCPHSLARSLQMALCSWRCLQMIKAFEASLIDYSDGADNCALCVGGYQ
jgi:hypothetical protein